MIERIQLISPNCKAIQELIYNFDINSIPQKKRDAMYKSYTNDYLAAREDYDISESVKDVLTEERRVLESKRRKRNDNLYLRKIYTVAELSEILIGKYPSISDEQFRSVFHNGIESARLQDIPDFWINPVTMLIPDEAINLSIIDEEMEKFGYVRVRLEAMAENNRRIWYFAVYNPNPKYIKSVRDVLRMSRFVHFSPEFNHDDIMETGLIPSNGGRTYTYPDERVFFYVFGTQFDVTQDEWFIGMLNSVSKKIKKENPSFSGIFNAYELDIRKLPEDISIFYDPNADNCVYINGHIEPQWFIYREDMFLEL